jgi:hypothetical protein
MGKVEPVSESSGAKAGRLDPQPPDPDNPQQLVGRVLVYCEGNIRNGHARLELYAFLVMARMQRAHPLLGREEPATNLLQMRREHFVAEPFAAETDPIRVVLVYIDERGLVDHLVTTRIRKLELSFPARSAAPDGP